MLKSALFAGDQLLQDIADDVGGVRISRQENASAPSVLKVQQALLIRDPGCLPVSGADGLFGDESAAAIHRFKVEELGVAESQVIDDVGPLTVQRLDEIALAAEVTSVALFNQFGDVLPNVDVEVDDGGVLRQGTTDALGIATVALTAGGILTVEPVSLAAALGDLLDRPVIPSDQSDPGDEAVIVPQTRIAVNIAPRSHVNIAIVARIDVRAELKTELEGEVRIDGTGIKVFREDEKNVRVALQVNDGSAAKALLDPLPSAGVPVGLPAVAGWHLPNGYIVQSGDTADSLSQRFLGAPGRFSSLSDHDPLVGEVLKLPDDAIPSWVGIAAQGLPPNPSPRTWFALTPNDVITTLYTDEGDMGALQQQLEGIASPPAADPDPAAAALAASEVIATFLTLPPDLIAADTLATPTSPEGAGLDGLDG
jgi:hypothetical protein